MAQAETYLEMIAECPKCGEEGSVEWVDTSVDGLEGWTCPKCGTEFTYCHPENQYGLAN